MQGLPGSRDPAVEVLLVREDVCVDIRLSLIKISQWTKCIFIVVPHTSNQSIQLAHIKIVNIFIVARYIGPFYYRDRSAGHWDGSVELGAVRA